MANAISSRPIPHTVWWCWGRPWTVGTPDQFRWLYGLLKVVLVLNLIDAVMTLFWVGTGLAKEANILMQVMVNDYPVVFMAVKMVLVSFGGWLLWQRHAHPLAVIGLVSVFVVYYGLILHHVRFASIVLSIFWF